MTQYSEERLQILKMIEEGKITAAEGLELINALDVTDLPLKKESAGVAKWLRIRVRSEDDKTKVNVNLPLALVDIALKMGTKYAPQLQEAGLEEIDMATISEAIKNGAEGKIIDVYDEKDKTTVEVYIE